MDRPSRQYDIEALSSAVAGGPAHRQFSFNKFIPLCTQEGVAQCSFCDLYNAELLCCISGCAKICTNQQSYYSRFLFRSKDTGVRATQVLGQSTFLWMQYANAFTFSFPSCLFCDFIALLKN